MNTSQHTQQMRSVGEYPQKTAFSVVRELEHAGIRTLITGSNETYQVRVSEGDYERALGRI